MNAEFEVSRGAQLLDATAPGWWNQIKLRKLDMVDDGNCILGQLWGNYFEGLANLREPDGRRYGFDGPDSAALVEAWKHEVLQRRGKVVQQ